MGTTILGSIITLLTSGIVQFATGFGSGLVALVKAIFLTVSESGAITGLNPFGELIIVFGAVALSFGMSRWVLNFITSLGQRNR